MSKNAWYWIKTISNFFKIHTDSYYKLKIYKTQFSEINTPTIVRVITIFSRLRSVTF